MLRPHPCARYAPASAPTGHTPRRLAASVVAHGYPQSGTDRVVFERLLSWPEHSDERVRYFSGTATYEKSFDVPADRLGADRELYLDLGDVQIHAEVESNGRVLNPTRYLQGR